MEENQIGLTIQDIEKEAESFFMCELSPYAPSVVKYRSAVLFGVHCVSLLMRKIEKSDVKKLSAKTEEK